MRLQLQQLVQGRVQQCVSHNRSENPCEKIERKKESNAKRGAEIVKVRAQGWITEAKLEGENTAVCYSVHYLYLIKQEELMYIEEEIEERKALFFNNHVIEDVAVDPFYDRLNKVDLPAQQGLEQFNPAIDAFRATQTVEANEPFITIRGNGEHSQGTAFQTKERVETARERLSFRYNRLKAVQYAERWWNTYNPAYKNFENDCTNFISQCLHQGGAPMMGYPNRGKGWWMRGQNYSYSWAVANSLKNFLGSSKTGLQARVVSNPEQLIFGDVICYDFQGDGRFDHNTIVTGKDANGMPLVNAHTYNSRQRYWAYEDSTAYTPNIKYKFYSIDDEQ